MTSADGLKTATVDLQEQGIELEVLAHPTPELKALFDEIAAGAGDPDAVAEEMLDAIELLIVDGPEPDDDPYTWRDRQVWEKVLELYGADTLAGLFVELSAPAVENAPRGVLQRVGDYIG